MSNVVCWFVSKGFRSIRCLFLTLPDLLRYLYSVEHSSMYSVWDIVLRGASKWLIHLFCWAKTIVAYKSPRRYPHVSERMERRKNFLFFDWSIGYRDLALAFISACSQAFPSFAISCYPSLVWNSVDCLTLVKPYLQGQSSFGRAGQWTKRPLHFGIYLPLFFITNAFKFQEKREQI